MPIGMRGHAEKSSISVSADSERTNVLFMSRKLLIISPTPTHPTNAGNRARVRKWLELCVEEGVDFHFAFFRHEGGDESAMIQAWGADRCSFLDYEPPRRHYPLLARLRRRLARVVHRLSLIHI